MFIVRCAPDGDKFKPVSVRAELRQGRKYLVCYLGIMGAQDGVDYLIHSIRHIIYDLWVSRTRRLCWWAGATS